jgi:hypothetical protein
MGAVRALPARTGGDETKRVAAKTEAALIDYWERFSVDARRVVWLHLTAESRQVLRDAYGEDVICAGT